MRIMCYKYKKFIFNINVLIIKKKKKKLPIIGTKFSLVVEFSLFLDNSNSWFQSTLRLSISFSVYFTISIVIRSNQFQSTYSMLQKFKNDYCIDPYTSSFFKT